MNMNEHDHTQLPGLLMKAASIKTLTVTQQELELINRQAIKPLKAEEVFAFRLAACNDQVDRDYEQFSEEALEGLAKLFVGRTVLKDHAWSSANQTARIYAADVEAATIGGNADAHQLVLRCYMLRLDSTADTIASLEGGILRECSVGVRMGTVTCSICGVNQREHWCDHFQGHQYEGKLCTMTLDDPREAYEVSLVAVPAQPEAGVIKSKRYGGPGQPKQEPPAAAAGEEDQARIAEARQREAEIRYGGI